MIKLIIIKNIPNENFEAEMQEFNERNRMSMMSPKYRDSEYIPSATKTENVMEVSITEKQWEAIRKSVIDQF